MATISARAELGPPLRNRIHAARMRRSMGKWELVTAIAAIDPRVGSLSTIAAWLEDGGAHKIPAVAVPLIAKALRVKPGDLFATSRAASRGARTASRARGKASRAAS